MAKAQDMGHHLSELIFQALPTNGREMVNQEFPGGISKLTDYDSLLNFLSRTASAFHGRRTQPGIYIAQQWAPHALLSKKRTMEDNSTSAGPPNKKPKLLHNISSGTAVVSGRPAPSAKPASSAKLAQVDQPCVHPLCKQLPVEAMASHLNSNCLRKIPDRKAWIALIKQHQPLVDQIKASGTWPGPNGQSAKQTVSAISTLSASAAAPKAKKPKSKSKTKSTAPAPVAASINNRTVSGMDVEMEEYEDSSLSDFDYEAMNNAISSPYLN
ncbi:hypothetical protein BGX24_007173, partial [Mortierella sp. AD032]